MWRGSRRARIRRRRAGATTALLVGALSLGLGAALLPEPAAATPPSQAPSAAGPSARTSTEAALARAASTGEPVEVTSLRSETGEVFATADGNLEAREHLRPVRVRRDGAWQDIDTDLTVKGGAVAPKAAAIGLEFSAGGTGPLVKMARAGRRVALSWPRELPAPELSGPTATYRNVLPDVDLRMEAQEDGFTQLLVVKSAEAAASEEVAELRLKLDTAGVAVGETADGGLEAVDRGAGGAVFEAPEPMMWDSSTAATRKRTAPTDASRRGPPASAAPQKEVEEPSAGESARLAPVAVDVPAGGDALVLTPDAELLTGEDTTYPVYIDPQWYAPDAGAWTMASKYWAGSPQWKFNGEHDAGLGYCDWNYCQPHDTKRLFYRIAVSMFAGKSVLSAEFVVRNTWSASCSAREVELWRTKGISDRTTWNSQNASGFWQQRLDTRSFAYGYSGCAAKDAEFDVKSAVQSAADDRASTLTFGLRAGSESDGLAWKRLSDKAFLRVKYNRPPAQIKTSQLTAEYGGPCKDSAHAARVRTLGRIRASRVTDPDGDPVAVQFQAKWDAGDGKGLITRWSPARSSAKSSGSDFSISLPAVPAGKQVNWYVRAWDGAQYSPWSYAGDPTACYFVHDTTVPKGPAVASGDYPRSDPENPDDPWFDGVGKYGSFEIEAAAGDTDVTSYWYGINGDPSSANKVTTSGGAARIAKVLPAKSGVNFFTARAFDAAGNGSEVFTYHYRVKAGQPARATWQLDEGEGAAQAAGSTPPRTAALHGGATPGAQGVQGTAVGFDGTGGYASTDLPVVNTSGGFAVSAWVKPDRLPEGAAVVATQPGNHSPGFELYYSKTYDRWAFNQYTADKEDAGIARAMGDTPGTVQPGTWTHLVGSYSSTSDLLQLFVDGRLVGQTAYSTPWEARRGLQIGAGSYNGAPAAFFPGSVDALQLFDKPLAQDEVDKLHAQQSVGDPGRPALAVFDLDEPAEATELTGHGGVLPAVHQGGVRTGAPGVAGKVAVFDGTSGYARIGRTSGPHLNTSRSFTVSAWARLDRKPTGAAVITAQAGKSAPGFELYYSATYNRWAVNQYSADAADATPIRAMQPEGRSAAVGEWAHLVGVHDTVANTLTLYVNGAKAGSTSLSGAFYADQSMYLGAGSYAGRTGNFFPGSIDDVRLLDRPASAEEVQQMFKQRPLVTGRWNFESSSGTGPVTTPDSSAASRPMTLNKAAIGHGWIDSQGLELDGVDGYAATAVSPVDSGSSFTLTAWAQAAAAPDHPMTLLSGEGAQRDAFEVRYVPDAANPEGLGRWEVALPAEDDPKAEVTRLTSTQFDDVRNWNHLALVYDGFAKEARLYVNGVLQDSVCGEAGGDGDGSDCEKLTAWAENVLTFGSGRPLQVGRSARSAEGHFAGVVDDVWAFQGALTESQIGNLTREWGDIPTDVPELGTG
ncbi:LamG domain protein jellyroll fold domain protein [Streptomyces albus]|uniref:LamG domain protein jellyroll fold domain protein n=1 Tax=Streptomyces albus (strain ATCC 21838 / DSM 41398 / FERM P-419 / JCM 4703 / NBRC 107858) TaxID=1081613 RepID=A0A0B5EMI1_STRA4|nr:LamG domain protein jellyroll fold domain protein [Streptomyces albus]AOU77061.1 LamG domain protein jellyroll fold domain protein [Streptomyces albus]